MDYETTSPGSIPTLAKTSMREAILAAYQTDLDAEVARATAAENGKQPLRTQLTNYGVKGANIASASTTNLSGATGDYIVITGTTTINAFSDEVAGTIHTVEFAGSLTLTHSSNLRLPSQVNILTEAGDIAILRSLSTGVWKCINYERQSGIPLIGQAFSTLTSKPTTLSGYGITDGQPLDSTLTALSVNNWEYNSVPVGTGTDTVDQINLPTYTILGRQGGDVESLTLTPYGYELIKCVDADEVKTLLDIDGSGSGGTGTIVTTQYGGTGMNNQFLVSDRILYTSATGVFDSTTLTPTARNFLSSVNSSSGSGGIIFQTGATINSPTISAGTFSGNFSGNPTFTGNITFSGNVTLGSSGVFAVNKSTTFNSNVVFNSATVAIGSFTTGGSFNAVGSATFDSGVVFNSDCDFNLNLNIGSSSTLNVQGSSEFHGTCDFSDAISTSGVTQVYGTNNTEFATTAFVQNAVSPLAGIKYDFLSPLSSPVVSITAATTLTSTAFNKFHLCSGTTADYTVVLPAVSGNSGKFIGFIFSSSSLNKLVTLDGNASETIGGSLTRSFWSGETVVLYCDGSAWFRVSGNHIPMNCALSNSASQSGSFTNSVYLTDTVNSPTNQPVMGETTNRTITIRRSGYYSINSSLIWAGGAGGANTTAFLSIYIGTVVSGGLVTATTTLDSQQYYPISFGTTTNISKNIYMNSGDILQVRVSHSAGASRTISSGGYFLVQEIPGW